MSADRGVEALTADDFRPLLGARFELAGTEGGSLRPELVEVAGIDAAGQGRVRAPFSIVFRGPREPVLPQNTYSVEHERLGLLELFLVPIGPDEIGMRYEAVFG